MEHRRIKYTSIEFIRFLAAAAVAMYHFGSFYLKVERFFPLSYIFVEFFFIISGFFMMKHICEKSDSMKPIPYIFKKISGFFPILSVTFFVQLIIFSLSNELDSAGAVLAQLFHFKWEFLLLHAAGFIQNPTFGVDYLQGQTWYLSAMVISLLLAYPLAKYFRKIFNYLICPLSCIIIYSYIVQTMGTLNVGNEYFGFILAAIPRGIAGTCVGCMTYNVYTYLKDKELNKTLATILEVLTYVSIIALFVLGRQFEGEDSLFYVLVFSAVVVLAVLNQTAISKFLNEKLIKPLGFLGKFSLYLYLCHWNVLMGMRYVKEDMATVPAFGIYTVICLLYSWILMYLDKKRKGWREIIIINVILLIIAIMTGLF